MSRTGYQGVILMGTVEHHEDGWIEVMRQVGPVVQASTTDNARYLIARHLTDAEYDGWAMAGKGVKKVAELA